MVVVPINGGGTNYSEKSYLNAMSFTKNTTLCDLGSNPGSYVGNLATNRLSYGTTFCPFTSLSIKINVIYNLHICRGL
jgi:hypothetical protein